MYNGTIDGDIRMDVERPEYRHRLWSVSDSQIPFYIATFSASRRRKQETQASYFGIPTSQQPRQP